MKYSSEQCGQQKVGKPTDMKMLMIVLEFIVEKMEGTS